MPQMLCSTLVGRDTEVARLAELQGTTVVVGEAGIGKSRLVHEVVRTAQDQGLLALVGRAVPGPQPVPYRPVAEAVLSACRRSRLPESAELAPYRPALGRFIPEWRRPDLAAATESPVVLGEGVLRLLQTLSGDAGVLLVLEDLHWSDAESLSVLEYLADHGHEIGLACVATIRPEPSPGAAALDALIARRVATRLELPPLPAPQVALMAQECLRSTSLPAGVADLIARADGVPFLIEELLAAAADSGLLVHGGDGWVLRPGAAAIVPRTLSDAIAQRTNALGSDADILRVAAMLGRRVDPGLVAEVLVTSADAVREVLDRCVGLQLLATVEGASYEFRHALTRESILARLTPSTRVRLAERAITVVESDRPELPEQWCLVAAELHLLAGDPKRTAQSLFMAAQRGVADGALATAASQLARARELLTERSQQSLTRDPRDVELSLEIDELRTEVAALAGDLQDALAIGESLVASMVGPARRTRIHLVLAHAASDAAQWATARQQLGMASADDDATQARVDALAARVALGEERPDEAAASAHRALEIAERHDLAEPACQALEVLGRMARLRNLAEAHSAFARQLEIAERHGLAPWVIRATHELGTIDMLTSNGVSALQRAREMAVAAGMLGTVATLDLQLAASELMAFDVPACLAATARCQRAAHRWKLDLPLAAALMYECGAHAIAGNQPEMERAISEAVALGRTEPQLRSSAWSNRAMLRLLSENHDEAIAAYDQALAVERRSPMAAMGPHWGLSALLRSVRGSGRPEREELRDRIPTGAFLNEAHLEYADAVVAGQSGEPARAEALFRAARAKMQTGRGAAGRRHLAERLVAESALTDGWGQPVAWLTDAAAFFQSTHHVAVERACRSLLRRAGVPQRRPERSRRDVAPPLAALGITDREADILALVVKGFTSREIAGQLYISARTVDKHVERLLAKTGLERRSQLRRFNT